MIEKILIQGEIATLNSREESLVGGKAEDEAAAAADRVLSNELRLYLLSNQKIFV